MKRWSVVLWSVVGAVFVSVAGVLLHFLYDWLGQSAVVGVFSAVNESIWEHMKLLYVSLMLFAVVESRFLADRYPAFWCVKLLSTVVGLFIIPTLYYTYTGALGVKADWFNIAIYFIATAAVFFIEARLLRGAYPCTVMPRNAVALLVGIGVLFVLFTFYPPQIPLFRDPTDGSYGIVK